MKASVWVGFAVVFCLCIGLGKMAKAEESTSITFQFNPKNGVTYNQKVTLRSEKKFLLPEVKTDKEGDTSDSKQAGAEDGNLKDTQVDETVSKTKVVVKKTDTGWEMKLEPLGAITKKDGNPLKNPGSSIFPNFSFILKLDSTGKVEDVVGFDQLEAVISSRYPPDKAKKFIAMLNNDKIKEKEIAEWNGKIGNYVGKTVRIGEVTEASMALTVPGEADVTCKVKTEYKNIERCGLAQCLRIEQTFDNKDALLDKALKDAAEQDKKKDGEEKKEASDTPKEKKIMIEGKLVRLIEPDTMLIYKEEMERTILLESAFMGRDNVPTTITEKRTFEYEYL